VEEYDKKKFVPHLVVVFESLNPNHPQTPPLNPLVLNDLLFGELASTKEASEVWI
jgi:hypothetical protein